MAAPQAFSDADARPAEPLLAAQLLSDEELDELLDDICGVDLGKRRRDGVNVLSTGVKSLDDALDGGLEDGRVVSGSFEPGGGGNELCQTLLVNSLLKYDNSTAAVIDTTGNFDILRLYSLILTHLQRNPTVLSSFQPINATSDSEVKVDDVAARVLDRVKIMRVFDFVGVSEAVSEIRDVLEGRIAVEAKQESIPTEAEKPPAVEIPPRRTFVADSEDEEDDEMLFDSEATVPEPEPEPECAPAPALEEPRLELPQKTTSEHHLEEQGPGHGKEGSGKVKFILIDNLAQVLNPLLKRDYIQANALASTFLQSLAHLTSIHKLHTMLINPTTKLHEPSPTRHAPQNPGQAPPPQQNTQQPPQSPSIFASSTAIPSLMNVLGRYVDVGLLVTKMPKSRLDARVFYSDSGGGQGNRAGVKKRGVKMVSVMEVMSDRWAGRVGAWGTFIESSTGIDGIS
ncbi:hypothetical protein BKA66DRAFT_570517 [Pyrenochaeta sp. MPI-SDFR-AT-0127]|nr:hypothetical protein BKA66DRAFT_570517 [Pyrenochaeta sp. MPI-SDFR-AT-0127]